MSYLNIYMSRLIERSFFIKRYFFLLNVIFFIKRYFFHKTLIIKDLWHKGPRRRAVTH